MERRWSERVPLSNEVILHFPAGRTVAKARDLNLEGLFLEMEPDSLQGVESLEVEFCFGEAPNEHYRIPANTIHREAHGIGVSLQYDDDETFRRIRDLWMRDAS